jgi:hypothetical protein
MASNVAELGYSKDTNSVELILPHGTKTADLHAVINKLQTSNIVSRLPRGCNTCLSGANWNIKERLEWVVRVDLATNKVIEE